MAGKRAASLLADIPVGGLVHPPEFIALVARQFLVVGLDIHALIQGNFRNNIGQPALGQNIFIFAVAELDREARLVEGLVELGIADVGCILADAAVGIGRNLRAVIRRVGERIWFRRVAVVVRVHGQIEVVAVDDAAAGAGAEQAAGG